MFDLEKAITSWRRSFRHRRVFLEDDLEELERHVRDHTAWLVEQGCSEKEAFYKALESVGGYALVEAEYRKVFWDKLKHKRRLLRELTWRGVMLKNYLKVALRTLQKHKGYAFINVAGLSVGIACCLLIMLYVMDELQFDAFHEKADRIYRVVEVQQAPDQGDQHFGDTVGPLGPALVSAFPEVVEAVRLVLSRTLTLQREDQRILSNDYLFAEPSFFEIFDFELLAGDRSTALSEPRTVVLTEKVARQLFGAENPLGAILEVEVLGEVTVTGVLKDPPYNSHLDFGLLFSFSTLAPMLRPAGGRWGDMNSWERGALRGRILTYIVLGEGQSADELEAKFRSFSRTHRGEDVWATHRFYLQPLKNIHFDSGHLVFDLNQNPGRRAYLYVFSAIAWFILLIACINYMNLSTARSAHRAREVGIRKVVGAHRWQLVGQFISESVLLAFLAFIIAGVLVWLALPSFNHLSDKEITLDALANGKLALALLGVASLIGFISGSYPAFYLSRLRIVRVLKGAVQRGAKALRLRYGLVVTQFTLSIAMMVATLIVYEQLHYIQNKPLGFNKDQLVMIDINSAGARRNHKTMKHELGRHPQVVDVAVSSRVPGDWKRITDAEVIPEGRPETEPVITSFFCIDADFMEVYDLELVAGRNLRDDVDTVAVLLNEAAVRAFGWTDDPLGRLVQVPSEAFEARVVGVVKDFHFKSLYEEIGPLMLGVPAYNGWHPIEGIDYYAVRIQGDNMAETLNHLQRVHAQFDPVTPMLYNFLDERLDDFYTNDARVGTLLGIAAAFAILVACLGLFGLVAFTAEQRTKEIGVRKVVGASVTSIVVLLSKKYLALVGLAFVVAAPVAYLAMVQWLESFAYRIEISWGIFLAAGLAALGIALLTVSYQAIRAALADPVKALRYE